MWQLNACVGFVSISGKSNRKNSFAYGFSSSYSLTARNGVPLITTPFNSNALIFVAANGKRFVTICMSFNDSEHRLEFITHWAAWDPSALEETETNSCLFVNGMGAWTHCRRAINLYFHWVDAFNRPTMWFMNSMNLYRLWLSSGGNSIVYV